MFYIFSRRSTWETTLSNPTPRQGRFRKILLGNRVGKSLLFRGTNFAPGRRHCGARSYTKIGWSTIEMKNETGFPVKKYRTSRKRSVWGVCFGRLRHLLRKRKRFGGYKAESQKKNGDKITCFERKKEVLPWRTNFHAELLLTQHPSTF